MNDVKLIINGTKYEVTEYDLKYKTSDTPIIYFGNKSYVGLPEKNKEYNSFTPFITEDGYNVTDKDTVIYTAIGSTVKQSKLFYKKENRDRWVEENTKKIPLFTTEDGIDVYEGDSYWCVNTAPHLWSLFEQKSKNNTKLNKGVLAFSIKSAAEIYMLNNKPVMVSLKELNQFIERSGTWQILQKNLTELFKSKI